MEYWSGLRRREVWQGVGGPILTACCPPWSTIHCAVRQTHHELLHAVCPSELVAGTHRQELEAYADAWLRYEGFATLAGRDRASPGLGPYDMEQEYGLVGKHHARRPDARQLFSWRPVRATRTTGRPSKACISAAPALIGWRHQRHQRENSSREILKDLKHVARTVRTRLKLPACRTSAVLPDAGDLAELIKVHW